METWDLKSLWAEFTARMAVLLAACCLLLSVVGCDPLPKDHCFANPDYPGCGLDSGETGEADSGKADDTATGDSADSDTGDSDSAETDDTAGTSDSGEEIPLTPEELLAEPFPGSLWYYEIQSGADRIATDLETPEIVYTDLDRVTVYEKGEGEVWETIQILSPWDGSLQGEIPFPVEGWIQCSDNCLTVIVDPEDPYRFCELNWVSYEVGDAFAYAWLDHAGDGTIWHELDGDGHFWGSQGGSHLSALGGTIRVGELSEDSIDHVVKIEVDNGHLFYSSTEEDGQSGFRYPAHSCDSYADEEGEGQYTGDQAQLQMGSLMTLPAGYDCGQLLTAPAQRVCTAMQTYGALIVDDTYGVGAVALVVENGVDNELTDLLGYDPEDYSRGWSHDLSEIFGSLEVVDDPEASWN